MQRDKDFWTGMLDDPSFRELFSGRGVIADYIKLRDRNDEIRTKAVEILFSAIGALVHEAEKKGVALSSEEFDECSFEQRPARVTGPGLRIRHGVRCLTVEAGWTRVPSDGVMGEGALALARLSHFGFPEKTTVLYLLIFEERPRWFTIGRDGIRRSFEAEELVQHLQLLIGA